MSKYTSINSIALSNEFIDSNGDDLRELMMLLSLLEKVNPCKQEYEVVENNLIISYSLKLNLFNFRNMYPLKANVQIIGLPISVCLKGYLGDSRAVEKIIKKRKGIKIILNSDSPFKGGGNTLSTFVFENNFSSFDEYLSMLRSSYRRRINQALKNREKLTIKKFSKHEFSTEHYQLYQSVMNRTENPLETLPMEFFQQYDAELYEFRYKNTNEAAGFVQLKESKDTLYFLFGGFNKADIEKCDIYYNMLLKILEVGIEKSVKKIEFGQTAEETKLKIGCKEKYKYLYIHHSNPIINFFIRLLVPLFTYKPYAIEHHVFKHKNEE